MMKRILLFLLLAVFSGCLSQAQTIGPGGGGSGSGGAVTSVAVVGAGGATTSGTCSSTSSVNCTVTSAAIAGATTNLRAALATAGTTITVTADNVVVCTALGGTCYQLSSYSQLFTGTGTGAGGMDTGAIPTSSWLALYAIYNTSGPTISIVGTTCAVSCPTIYNGGHMPSGYTASALLTVLPTNGTPAIAASYAVGRQVYEAPNSVVNSSSTSVSCTQLSIAAAVPPNAVSVSGNLFVLTGTAPSAGNYNIFLGPDSGCSVGFQEVQGPFTATGSQAIQAAFSYIPLPTAQNIWYGLSNSGTTPNAKINVTSYNIPATQ